jgi:Ni,Fe-hydrogenase III large subunit
MVCPHRRGDAVSALTDLIRAGRSAPCHPWPRFVLDAAAWRAMATALAADPSVDLLALWADPQLVHALLHDREGGAMLPVSVPTESGFYPALSRARPAAAWFERMIRDLFGHHAEDGRDGRPWLDHGAWALHAPLSARPVAVAGQLEAPEFLTPEGMQIPLGPVLSGFGEPAALRLTVAGERVLRLEARLGYAHKGTLALMRGKSPRAAARFAARLAGDATVAHSIAFARAAEAASAIVVPPRAVALRAIMAELERIGSHVFDLVAVAEAIGFAPVGAAFARLRETLARTANAAFGHRLMMDVALPGGVAADLSPEGAEAVAATARHVAKTVPELRALFTDGKNVAERLAGSGVLRPEFADALAVGGVVGRAGGRAADLRRDIAEPPYDSHRFGTTLSHAGDAAARVEMRFAEIGDSAALLQSFLAALPPGPLAVPLPPVGGEGIGWAEGGRGDIWHWLQLEGGQIVCAFARDPGWLLWPALEATAPGVALADVPLLLASFGATVSGMDL